MGVIYLKLLIFYLCQHVGRHLCKMIFLGGLFISIVNKILSLVYIKYLIKNSNLIIDQYKYKFFLNFVMWPKFFNRKFYNLWMSRIWPYKTIYCRPRKRFLLKITTLSLKRIHFTKIFKITPFLFSIYFYFTSFTILSHYYFSNFAVLTTLILTFIPFNRHFSL